jgi:glycosyltransferase involved in cell wall biosynthesis
MEKISALIICRNEEKNIEECIKSIKWCDEIIIIDGFSTDNTFEIAKGYTDKVFRNEWKGFFDQRSFGLTKIQYNWIFSIDADERCTEHLSAEIQNLLSRDLISANGFLIPRKSFFLGKWIKHCGWYPDHQLRLFRKDFVSVTVRLVHESYSVSGETGKLKNNLEHFTVNSISDFMNKVNIYSSLSASEKPNKRITFIYILFKPFIEFSKKFIFQAGFLDGIHGLMVSFFHTITKTMTYMKIWETQNKVK